MWGRVLGLLLLARWPADGAPGLRERIDAILMENVPKFTTNLTDHDSDLIRAEANLESQDAAKQSEIAENPDLFQRFQELFTLSLDQAGVPEGSTGFLVKAISQLMSDVNRTKLESAPYNQLSADFHHLNSSEQSAVNEVFPSLVPTINSVYWHTLLQRTHWG